MIIHIEESENSCETYRKGQLEDVIEVAKDATSAKEGWSICCRDLDLVGRSHPGIKKNTDFERLSTFGAIELYNVLWQMSSYFEQWTADTLIYRQDFEAGSNRSGGAFGFKTYTKSVISEIFGRGLIVLRDLGFRPTMSGFMFSPKGTRCDGHESDPEIVRKKIITEGESHRVEGFLGTRYVEGVGREYYVELDRGRYWFPEQGDYSG